MPQGVLPYEYKVVNSASGLTALAGLPTVLDLALILGLADSIDKEVQIRTHSRYWTDSQHVLSLILLNLAGGDCVDDIDRLENDDGFQRLLQRVEDRHLPRYKRRERVQRWPKGQKTRAVPSPSSLRRYLCQFINQEEESKRSQGKAFIPSPSEPLKGLGRVLSHLVSEAQKISPQSVATLDLDATIVDCHQKDALFHYKGSRGYQPLNVWWAEQKLIVRSEFRDGNVNASFQNLRVLKEAIASLPEGVETVRFRADGASYQSELLSYCEEGKDPRFGRIEFVVSAPINQAFKAAIQKLDEEDWSPIYEYFKDPKKTPRPTGREYAEVPYVPNKLGLKHKRGYEYRFVATRSLRSQPVLKGLEAKEAPFPTYEVGDLQYKLRGVVTNLRSSDGWDGEDVIRELDARCGRSELAHAEMKHDLAGGTLPSKYFGASAAWWQIMILSLNVMKIFSRIVLGKTWANRRMKAIRFHVLNVAGRVVEQGRKLYIKLSPRSQAAGDLLIKARKLIQSLARGPPKGADL